MSFSINEDGLTISVYDETVNSRKHFTAPRWFNKINYVADRGFSENLSLYEDKISDNVFVLKRGEYEIARYLKVDNKVAPIRFLKWRPNRYMIPYAVELMHIGRSDILNFSSKTPTDKRARIITQYREGIKRFRNTLNSTLLTLVTYDYIFKDMQSIRLLNFVDVDEKILSHFRKFYYKTKKIISVPTSESGCYTVIKEDVK